MSAPGVTGIDSEAAYGDAVDAVLNAAQREICIFDNDLAKLHLEELKRVTALGRFLTGSRLARLRIVVHDPARLETRLPRLVTLLGRYSHANEVRRTSDEIRHLSDSALLVDDAFAVVRFHVAYPRGKMIFGDPVETANLRERFEQIWAHSSQMSVNSTLGL